MIGSSADLICACWSLRVELIKRLRKEEVSWTKERVAGRKWRKLVLERLKVTKKLSLLRFQRPLMSYRSEFWTVVTALHEIIDVLMDTRRPESFCNIVLDVSGTQCAYASLKVLRIFSYSFKGATSRVLPLMCRKSYLFHNVKAFWFLRTKFMCSKSTFRTFI